MGYRPKESAAKSLAKAQEVVCQARNAYTRRETALAESMYRESLKLFREAHLYEPGNPRNRQRLHKTGKLIHDTFGCHLDFREGSYWIDCPVLLSHSEIGFSVGGSGKAICSVCGEDTITCPHVKGRTYDGVVATRWFGFCSICLEKECEHELGSIHDGVEACGIISEINLDHVAIVKNPANPLCVIHSHSLTRSELLELLPEPGRELFVYGKTVVDCHHCRVCEG